MLNVSGNTMKRTFGINDNFYYMQSFDENDSIYKFYDLFKEHFIGKYVAITAFDSGPLIIANDESEIGWYNVEKVAFSPLIKQDTLVPSGGFDEWYIFNDVSSNFKPTEILVNFAEIKICNEALTIQQKITYDIFWKEVKRNSPCMYLAEGGTLILATKDKKLFNKVKEYYC